jgi:hypothetical protein
MKAKQALFSAGTAIKNRTNKLTIDKERAVRVPPVLSEATLQNEHSTVSSAVE